MKKLNKLLTFIFLVVGCQVSAAVHVSQTDQGQAIIFPFFSVANGINTLVTINNHDETPKAIKVNIREASKGMAMYSFNLYLDSHDIWTMGMLETNGFINIIVNDQSCVLNLEPADEANAANWEWQTGMLEVIEMGNFSNASNRFFADETTAEENCTEIAEGWAESGIWLTDSSAELTEVSGGITGQVSVIDVAKGFSFQVPSMVLDNFFPENSISHFPAESELPDLSSGDQQSLMIYQGEPITTVWPTGYEAVSALLMKTTTENEFSIETFADAKSEWVISFPTLSYHLANSQTTSPFIMNDTEPALEDGRFLFASGLDGDVVAYDREGNDYSVYFAGDPLPPASLRALSFNSMVNTNMILDSVDFENGQITNTSVISGATRDNVFPFTVNHLTSITNSTAPTSGKRINQMLYHPNDRGINANDQTSQIYHGLPFMAFSFNQFTNANASPSIMATYATVKLNHSEVRIE